MKTSFFTLFLTCFLITNILQAAPKPIPPTIKAKGYFLIEMNSGEVLVEHNADERLEPASLTKIMTAYVVFQAIKEGDINIDDQVLISRKAWKMKGSRMFIEVKKKVSVEDLLKGMIIQSGNDAAVALAEHTAGSEESFAQLMNHEAEALGMTNSHFKNVSGLPAKEHYTTARDIAKVTAKIIKNFPDFYEWYSQESFTYNGIKQSNRNRLLQRDPAVDGVKTGYTKAAGYCLVSSALKENMRLIGVVMGAKNSHARLDESQKLLSFGFLFYETHKIHEANKSLINVRIWQGDSKELPLGIDKDLYVTIPRKQYDHLDQKMNIVEPIKAPKEKGETIGKFELTLNGEIIKSIPLKALTTVKKGGFFGNMIDSVKLRFSK